MSSSRSWPRESRDLPIGPRRRAAIRLARRLRCLPSMRSYWLAFPWLIGCNSATLNSTVGAAPSRLTPFRDELFREGALREVCVDGRRYCVADLGKGPPLVLLHGLGGSLYDWRHVLRPLARHHRVL